MASTVTIQVPRHVAGEGDFTSLTRRALAVFHDLEKEATRFVASSPLMRSNATPTRWHRVPPRLFGALGEAYDEYRRTRGVFDPRVVADLESLGYDATLRFGASEARRIPRDRDVSVRGTWAPKFRRPRREVWLGEAVELGGIGKGLAVRGARDVLAPHWGDYLIEAGGDCFVAGLSPEGAPWRIGVEDPRGGATPLAVLALSDRAVATSSTLRRRWRVGEEQVHHLIDPRTRRSGGAGLASVTVVGADPARAEVDAKVLFLAGREDVAATARAQQLAALWCDVEGRVNLSDAMTPYVIWEAT